MKHLKDSLRLGIYTLALSIFPLKVSALDFNFSSLAGFSDPARDALARAAAQWTSRISDPITVNIRTEFQDLSSSNVIGTASSVTLVSEPGFSDNVIHQLKIDSAAESDDGIVASLPTVGNLNIALPTGFGFAGHLAGTKANFKALALPGIDLDNIFGSIDAEINFNTGFNFDFDNNNGVTGGYMDFETVAAHELGHALGFVSTVDDIDYFLNLGLSGTVAPTLLDLFRFGPGDGPSNAAEFATAARNLIPGEATFFDDTSDEYLFSTGVTQGDGRQASHWKDTDTIGILDPTLAFGQVFDISQADLRALDLIGYDITSVPLPPGLVLFGSALLMLVYKNNRRVISLTERI